MDWTTLIIGALLGAIVSIPFGIFVNFATPWVKSYFEKRKLTTTERRIFTLTEAFRKIKGYKKDSQKLVVVILQTVAILVGNVILGIASVGTLALWGFTKSTTANDILLFWVGAIFLFWFVFTSTQILYSLLSLVKRVNTFDAYREETIAELKKLGGNPEDLDKVEEEVSKPVEETKTLKRTKKKVG